MLCPTRRARCLLAFLWVRRANALSARLFATRPVELASTGRVRLRGGRIVKVEFLLGHGAVERAHCDILT